MTGSPYSGRGNALKARCRANGRRGALCRYALVNPGAGQECRWSYCGWNASGKDAAVEIASGRYFAMRMAIDVALAPRRPDVAISLLRAYSDDEPHQKYRDKAIAWAIKLEATKGSS